VAVASFVLPVAADAAAPVVVFGLSAVSAGAAATDVPFVPADAAVTVAPTVSEVVPMVVPDVAAAVSVIAAAVFPVAAVICACSALQAVIANTSRIAGNILFSILCLSLLSIYYVDIKCI
jgi:hypothetical protein